MTDKRKWIDSFDVPPPKTVEQIQTELHADDADEGFRQIVRLALRDHADELRADGAAQERARIRAEVERLADTAEGFTPSRFLAYRAVLAFIDKGDDHA